MARSVGVGLVLVYRRGPREQPPPRPTADAIFAGAACAGNAAACCVPSARASVANISTPGAARPGTRVDSRSLKEPPGHWGPFSHALIAAL